MIDKRQIAISKPYVGPEEKAAVMEVLDSGVLAQGPRTAAFEKAFAAAIGTKHAVATSSGTTALHLALLAHGVGPGDEVVTSPFTFIASANSVLFTGAKVVFADIDPVTFNVDPAAVEAAITPRTKAILPVHLYGQPADMDPLVALAKKHGLALVEDAAQAIGAAYKGKRAGSFGTGAFSLYATKNVMSAEGGMVTTDDDAIAELCRTLRQHGMRRRYHHDLLGFNFRMTDLHAAIGLAQLARLDAFSAARQKNARALTEGLHRVKTPVVAPDRTHVFHQYTVRLEGGAEARDRAVERLNERGVGCGVFYPVPAHKQAHLRERGHGAEHLPHAEAAAREVFSLPVHPGLTPEDLAYIVQEVEAL